ncbi:PAS domain S-box protein [Reyranella sp. CPCC 100927]|uniref:PAS domain S-box protein n=1 Tax=Reyranella sp. CPCC 100927 TaxID=2599616 RepID=UPI0011B4389D|nr:PAS domain S-box protein [Reyranella sp. CPCC 100927]TWT10149.1 PAS domain S-box protein [Reyranella sp. CPCC 100927]
MSTDTGMDALRRRLPSPRAMRRFGRSLCIGFAVACGVAGLLAAAGHLPLVPVEATTSYVTVLLSLTIACLLVMLWWSDRQGHRMTERVIEIEKARRWSDRRLSEIIEASSEGIVVYDANDRLVLCNAKFRDTLTTNGGALRYGAVYEDNLRQSVRLGVYTGIDDPDAWIAARKAALRTTSPPETVRMATGTWMRISNRVLSDGSVVGMRTDVTDLKRRELELTNRETRLSRLFSTLADVVLELGANGIITHASPAARQVLGFEPADLEGMRLDDLFPSENRERVYELRRRLHEGAVQSEAVALYSKPSGETIHVEVRLWLSDRSTGEQIVTGTIRDVDDREKAAALAAREAALVGSLANASGAYMIVLDSAGHFIRGNTAFGELVGIDNDDMSGRLLSANQKTRALASIVEPAVRDGGVDDFPFEFDVILLDRRDTKHTIRFAASAVPDPDGGLRYAVLVGIDDTARRNAETALFEASKLSKLGEMAAAMAHELNQPLAVIRMAAENAIDELDLEPLPDAGMADFLRGKLKRIADQTDRASKVISQLRAHARKGDDHPAPFDVPEAVQSALDLVSEQLKLDGVQIVVASEPCPSAIGHRSRFEQVVINLMTNARDAIKMVPAAHREQRPGRIELRIRPSEDRKRVQMSVHDNGPGIPDYALDRLFEPFFTTKPKGQGTGLGLSICHGIVSEMSGTLSAHNHAEGGAVFDIDLPASSARQPTVGREIAPAA